MYFLAETKARYYQWNIRRNINVLIFIDRSWYNHVHIYRYIFDILSWKDSFQYVLPLHYDNWCYSRRGRNKWLLKDKRSPGEKKSGFDLEKERSNWNIVLICSSYHHRLKKDKIKKNFINHFRFYVKVLLCWEWNSAMFKEELVS